MLCIEAGLTWLACARSLTWGQGMEFAVSDPRHVAVMTREARSDGARGRCGDNNGWGLLRISSDKKLQTSLENFEIGTCTYVVCRPVTRSATQTNQNASVRFEVAAESQDCRKSRWHLCACAVQSDCNIAIPADSMQGVITASAAAFRGRVTRAIIDYGTDIRREAAQNPVAAHRLRLLGANEPCEDSIAAGVQPQHGR